MILRSLSTNPTGAALALPIFCRVRLRELVKYVKHRIFCGIHWCLQWRTLRVLLFLGSYLLLPPPRQKKVPQDPSRKGVCAPMRYTRWNRKRWHSSLVVHVVFLMLPICCTYKPGSTRAPPVTKTTCPRFVRAYANAPVKECRRRDVGQSKFGRGGVLSSLELPGQPLICGNP